MYDTRVWRIVNDRRSTLPSSPGCLTPESPWGAYLEGTQKREPAPHTAKLIPHNHITPLPEPLDDALVGGLAVDVVVHEDLAVGVLHAVALPAHTHPETKRSNNQRNQRIRAWFFGGRR